MRRKILVSILIIICIIAAVFGYYIYRMWPMLSTTMGDVDMTEEHQSHNTAENSTDGETSTVLEGERSLILTDFHRERAMTRIRICFCGF
ncbi:MAG TPA: hypothetical protein H9955_14485 [Candidatus Mediterraneibacter cottocaccae]|nr:hypothetical protein [Candidatus Mediterraneibacter cottocaccae]